MAYIPIDTDQIPTGTCKFSFFKLTTHSVSISIAFSYTYLIHVIYTCSYAANFIHASIYRTQVGNKLSI